MELIQENPYRIVGILANSSEKELQKQKSKITKYASIGKQVDSELDFPFFRKIDRTENSIARAFSRIEQNSDKISNSLFWFIKNNSFDETALNYLINGHKEKAFEIWQKVTDGKDVSSKNFSCYNNIGTLKILSDSIDEIKEGIEAKIKLIESPSFTDFIHIVADQTCTIENQKQIEKFIDDILKAFNGKYSSSDTLNLFSNCNGTIQKYLSLKFTEEPLNKIEIEIETCKKKRKENKGNAYEFGLKLYSNTKVNLALLKSILGTSDLKYKALADQLANEIIQCGIDFFNESQEKKSRNNYLESSQKLTKIAESIAVGKITKDRIKDSLATLDDMKEREINQAIALLNSIKLAYEKAIKDIDTEVLMKTLGMPSNHRINYSKVAQLKANCLNWDKVVEVIRDSISIDDIGIIKGCPNESKVNEYKSLVDFLLEKLGPIHINQVKYICYWKDVKLSQAKSTAKQVGRTISSASDGCYIATMAYGDYNHPQVIELRKFRDDFLIKTMLGRYIIKVYYKYSPILVEKLKNKQKTNKIIRSTLDQFIKTIKK